MIRIEEVLFMVGLVSIFLQWRWNIISRRKNTTIQTIPKKINTYHADTSDINKDEVGEYFPYDDSPSKVGDLVVLEIYPEIEDIGEWFSHTEEYPPEYLVLAKVTRFNKQSLSRGFFCKILTKSLGDVK